MDPNILGPILGSLHFRKLPYVISDLGLKRFPFTAKKNLGPQKGEKDFLSTPVDGGALAECMAVHKTRPA